MTDLTAIARAGELRGQDAVWADVRYALRVARTLLIRESGRMNATAHRVRTDPQGHLVLLQTHFWDTGQLNRYARKISDGTWSAEKDSAGFCEAVFSRLEQIHEPLLDEISKFLSTHACKTGRVENAAHRDAAWSMIDRACSLLSVEQ